MTHSFISFDPASAVGRSYSFLFAIDKGEAQGPPVHPDFRLGAIDRPGDGLPPKSISLFKGLAVPAMKSGRAWGNSLAGSGLPARLNPANLYSSVLWRGSVKRGTPWSRLNDPHPGCMEVV